MTPPSARQPLRVAEIIHGAGLGGTERHVRSLLEGLPAHGIEPILIVSSEGPLLDLARSLDLEHRFLPRSSSWSYLGALTRTFEELEPDVVHAHSGRLPCLAARRARVPRIVETRHGVLVNIGITRWAGLALAEGWKCRLAHQTITVCEADRNWLIRRARLDPNRVRTVHNGIRMVNRDGASRHRDAADSKDAVSGSRFVEGVTQPRLTHDALDHQFVDLPGRRFEDGAADRRLEDGAADRRLGTADLRFTEGVDPASRVDQRRASQAALAIPDGGRWIGFVGRLTEQKTPERILDLLQELRPRDSRWRALMVGDGPEMHSLRERARRQGVDDAILWLGSDPRGTLAIQAVECVCLPSRSEGLPYVLLEGLAAGVPILATPVGGIPEVLAGPVLGRGCLEWDLPAWSARVQEMTAPGFSMEWALSARERIRTLDETTMLEALASIYRGVSTRPDPVHSASARG